MFFEEFRVGDAFELGIRTVSQADIDSFADLSGDHNVLHTAEAAAAAPFLGGLVAHGALCVALVTGLMSQAGLTRDSLVAMVGLSWTFKAPVRPGDTLAARAVVAECSETRNEMRGLVRFSVTVTNQRSEVVQEGDLTELVKRRGPG